MAANGIILKDFTPAIKEKYFIGELIGRGSNTVVFNDRRDPEKVIVCSRDYSKMRALEYMDIASDVEDGSFFSPFGYHNVDGLLDLPVYVMSMDKLQPLSLENKRIVRRVIKNIEDVKSDIYRHLSAEDKSGFPSPTRMAELERYTKYALWDACRGNGYPDGYEGKTITEETQNVMEKAVNAFSYLDEDRYGLDLAVRNFMQDDSGNIVANDTIHDVQLWHVLNKRIKHMPRSLQYDLEENRRIRLEEKGIRIA